MSQYGKLGVDTDKRGIEAFHQLTSLGSMFPHSFCPIYADPRREGYGIAMHSDGSGSKTVQNVLHYLITRDERFLGYTADDTVAMNVGDVLSVNAEIDGFVDYIAVNSFRVPKVEFLRAVGQRFGEVFEIYAKHGIPIPFMGGETADLPDQVRTADISGTVHGSVKLSDAVTEDNVSSGDIIIGLRSDGRAVWEDSENSGIMSNGLTLARHCLMVPDYEAICPASEPSNPNGRYYGKFRTDQYLSELGMTVGEAIISPTRHFGIVMKGLLGKYGPRIHGIVHNTGGGQTKTLRIGKNIRFVKDSLPEPPPLFYLIKQESGESWSDMHKGFNMGVGVDVIVTADMEQEVIAYARVLVSVHKEQDTVK